MKQVLVAGIGFRHDVDWHAIARAVQHALGPLSIDELGRIATLDNKAEAACLRAFCQQYQLPLQAIPRCAVAELEHGLTASAARQHLGLPGVAEPCALIAAGPGSRLLQPKLSLDGVSVALAVSAAPACRP